MFRGWVYGPTPIFMPGPAPVLSPLVQRCARLLRIFRIKMLEQDSPSRTHSSGGSHEYVFVHCALGQRDSSSLSDCIVFLQQLLRGVAPAVREEQRFRFPRFGSLVARSTFFLWAGHLWEAVCSILHSNPLFRAVSGTIQPRDNSPLRAGKKERTEIGW